METASQGPHNSGPFGCFDWIVCISVDDSPRLHGFRESMERAGIRRYDIDLRPRVGEYNSGIHDCNAVCMELRQRHLHLIRQAKARGHRNVLIFEDDARLVNTTGSESIRDWLKNEEWDMFYFGYSNVLRRSHRVTEHVDRIERGVYYAHAYAVHERAYDRIIDSIVSGDASTDGADDGDASTDGADVRGPQSRQNHHIDEIYYQCKLNKYCAHNVWFEQPIPNGVFRYTSLIRLLLSSDKQNFDRSLRQHILLNKCLWCVPNREELSTFMLCAILIGSIRMFLR